MSERVATPWSSRFSVWLLGLFAVPAVLLALGGDAGRAVLEYRHDAISAGEYWRFLSGHFVHGNGQHLVLNLLGVVMLAVLFPTHFTGWQWVLVTMASVLAIDVGLLWRHPEITWYVGLSGVLHGVLAAGACGWWRDEPWVLALTLTVIALGKLTWEQLAVAPIVVADMPAVINAHLYGALGGGIAGALLCYWQALKRRRGGQNPRSGLA